MHEVMRSEAYSKPYQTSEMEFSFENREQLKAVNYFRKKLHIRCLTVSLVKYLLNIISVNRSFG